MRSDADRLNDILDSITKIRGRTPDSFDAFRSDEMLQVWAIHHMQVVGEAARGPSQSFRDRHPEIPSAQIVALRNILVHEYFGLNLHQVWTMSQKNLPVLEEQVRRILNEISPSSARG